MPQKRVSMSLTSEIIARFDIALSDNNAAASNPIPAPSSPYATNHQTKYGSSKLAASSAVTGNFDRPCCMKTTANGIRKSQ
jgi:hypothetical protein